MSYHVMLCHVISCHIMSCHIMSYHVMLCHVISCHVISCNIALTLDYYHSFHNFYSALYNIAYHCITSHHILSHPILQSVGHGIESGAMLTIEDLQRTLQRALDFLSEGLEGADRRYPLSVLYNTDICDS